MDIELKVSSITVEPNSYIPSKYGNIGTYKFSVDTWSSLRMKEKHEVDLDLQLSIQINSPLPYSLSYAGSRYVFNL